MSTAPITVVSGLPRSGTSMMMRMLEAGGLEIVTDGARAADEDNPRGYYEVERVKRLEADSAWVAEARGKVVKVISALLRHLPPEYPYKVLFMERDIAEVLASQRQMLIRRGRNPEDVPDEQMAASFERHLARVREWLSQQPNFEVHYVAHRAVLERPAELVDGIRRFLGAPLEPARMIEAVDPSLYRQRG